MVWEFDARLLCGKLLKRNDFVLYKTQRKMQRDSIKLKGDKIFPSVINNSDKNLSFLPRHISTDFWQALFWIR